MTITKNLKSGVLFSCLSYRWDALFLLLILFLLLPLLLFSIAIVTGSEANSGKSRNGPIAGLRYDSDSITPYSGP